MSKSKNKKKSTPRGNIRKYRGLTLYSDLELDVVKALFSARRKLKKSFDFGYETEILDYTINGTYNPDIILTNSETGHKIYVEVKGYLDDQTRRKMLAVRRCHPDLDIRFLFQCDNKIRANSKMRYTDWAARNNFNGSAVGREIPVEWLVNTLEKENSKNEQQ